ncbi:HNH endonuclease [Massilia sp. Root351]|uniref:HNH endonuclease n=1 Tax=Massilia sp. Root351 TaxID=1736522 RepID=UPI0035A3818F
MYCESKITHLYFGDVEHIRPKSVFPRARLDVENLGLACAICNNNKGDYWDALYPVLDPYSDSTQDEIFALGHFVMHRPGRGRAKITIAHLDLNRAALLERRKERLELIQPLADQYADAPAGPLKDLLRSELRRQTSADTEYSLISRAFLSAAGID